MSEVTILNGIQYIGCTAPNESILHHTGTMDASQTIENGNTLTIAAGSNISTTGGSTDTVTVAYSGDDPVAMSIALG